MKISDLYKNKGPVFSVEVLPPRNGTGEEQVFELIEELKPYNLGFVSVTMGSDLSLRGGGLALAFLIKSKLNIEVLAHCTSIRRTKEEIENILTECGYLGLENILALRGDPARGEEKFTPCPGGHSYASEMVQQIVNANKGLYIRRSTDSSAINNMKSDNYRNGNATSFCIGVAGHPDGHPDCLNYEDNFIHLKKKEDNGAEYIITQAFYDMDKYKYFLDNCSKYGITIPVIPGIMPIVTPRNLLMTEKLFKVSIPKAFKDKYQKAVDSPESFKQVGIEHARYLLRELLLINPKGIQFFSLNRRGLIGEILSDIKGVIKSTCSCHEDLKCHTCPKPA